MIGEMTLTKPETSKERAGIQSVEVAARLLSALSNAPAPMTLKDLSAAADMPMSKAHRYLVSLARANLVEQDPVSSRYDLGALALTMGLTALARLDAVKLAIDALPGLRDETGETAVLAIWGEHGATVIRFEESAHPVRMNVRVGSTLPLVGSSIGHTFAAYLPEATTREYLSRLLGASGSVATDRQALEQVCEQVRARRLTGNVGAYVPGVSALAAPILNHQGQIAAVIGILGHQMSLDIAWDGAAARALDATARRLSQRLGYAE